MARLQVKRWSDFQHYSTRRPPWIKLHRSLLDDTVFVRLPVAARALAPLLWLLASESDDGTVEADSNELSFRLRVPQREIQAGLEALIAAGYLLADTTLASCKPDARLEEKSREEKEKRQRGASAGVSVERPEGVPEQVWKDWLRSRGKNLVTATVLAGIEREAAKAGWTVAEAITECATRGWRGFKADYVKRKRMPDEHPEFMPYGTGDCSCDKCKAVIAQRESARGIRNSAKDAPVAANGIIDDVLRGARGEGAA